MELWSVQHYISDAWAAWDLLKPGSSQGNTSEGDDFQAGDKITFKPSLKV